MDTCKIILAGFGGQGILFAGKVLAYSGLVTDQFVSWLPSYGPEMRGGTANCSVVVSNKPIGAPVISKPDVLIAMNRPSLDKFENAVAEGGYIIMDSSIIDREIERTDVKTIAIPATQMALEAGLDKLANMVVMGKIMKETGLFSMEILTEGLKKSVPPSKAALLEKNQQALQMGFDYE